MRANFHWISARVWYELGLALHWPYAIRQGERHIRAWLRDQGVRHGLRVLGDE